MSRLHNLVLIALGFVCLQLAFATPYLNVGLVKAPLWMQITLGLIGCTLFALGAVWAAGWIDRKPLSPATLVPRLSSRDWIVLVILAGGVIRILWDMAFPSYPISDGATYVDLAQKLSRGEAYATAGTFAYWPPGYPFLLSAVFSVFGYSQNVMLVFNLCLYALSILLVYLLAEQVTDAASARVATALIAIWPNHFMANNTEMKEYLLLAVLVCAVWLFLSAAESGRQSRIIRLVGGGVALGYATLIQPSTVLFITAIIAYSLMSRELRKRLPADLCLLLIGAAIVMTPWLARNYGVFGKVVITTGGGSVLYRANNPLATGGYTPRGEVSLEGLGELEENRKGQELAVKWISENPLAFLKLAVIKQIRFLGDDSSGVHGTLKWGAVNPAPAWGYAGVKAMSNLYWMAVWIGVFVTLMLILRRPQDYNPGIVLVALGFLYFYSIHSVFESNGKYHFQTIGFIAILAAPAFSRLASGVSAVLSKEAASPARSAAS